MTTFTATRGASTFPVFKPSGSGILSRSWGTIQVGVAPADDDIYQMCWVPAGAIIVGGYLHMEEMDTHTTETLDFMIGWAANGSDVADPNGLMLARVCTGDISVHLDVASTLTYFGGVLTAAGPKTLVNETLIQVECNTAAATFSAAQMSVYVDYLSP